MAYAAIGDVFKRWNPISTLVGSANDEVTSVDVSSVFIADAESFVDAYIGAKYSTPLDAPPPALITQVTADLGIFNMIVEQLPEVPDFMQKRYDRSIKILEQLRDGKMILSGIDTSSTGDEEVWANNQDKHSVFSPVLDDVDQEVDSNWVDAAKDERSGD